MLANEHATICDIIDAALTSDIETNSSVLGSDPSIIGSDSSAIGTNNPAPKIRWCLTCRSHGPKGEMVKCCGCYYWFHTLCEDGTEQKGSPDLRYSFWKCTDCRPDEPKGNIMDTKSWADFENDAHFENTDNEVVN
ncbi:hypothetical protein FCM35_KLT01273 [Carex littledalei]|uniref:PHD-type domain-containing protein n=1 Tax=Carex littledalei TaxID=544730 RepID=A0A833VC84_9POAL|nr:hypothetical protein FCM35_KLT01273 [Carex littledalei]